MNGFSTLKSLIVSGLVSLLCSCISHSKVDVPTPSPAVGNKYETPKGGAGNSDDKTGEQNASVVAEIAESEVARYFAPGAALEYKFTYLTSVASGVMQFNNGTASISVPGLPSGKAGDISLEISENKVVKLRAIKKNVTLTIGTNRITLTLEEVSGGVGDNKSDLIIDVQIAGSTGGNTTGGTGTGGGTGSGAPNFESIRAIAIKSCADANCHPTHAQADKEIFWQTYKLSLPGRLRGIGYPIMPNSSAKPSQVLAPGDLEKLLAYLGAL